MKSTYFFLLAFLTTFCLHGQSQLPTIVLTSKDVYTNSVRVITQPSTPCQNLVFLYSGKTSAEIEAIVKARPFVQVVKDGTIIVETDAPCAGYTAYGHTNYIGLVLIFNKYDQVKLAERTLHGD
jgi:hypothetical protein